MKKAKKAKKPAKKASKAIKKAAPVKKSGIGTPYGDRVLVKPEAVEQTTAFGIIIPDTSKEKPETGVVVAVGPDKKGAVQVGDRIMFEKKDYQEYKTVRIGTTEYYLIEEKQITYTF